VGSQGRTDSGIQGRWDERVTLWQLEAWEEKQGLLERWWRQVDSTNLGESQDVSWHCCGITGAGTDGPGLALLRHHWVCLGTRCGCGRAAPARVTHLPTAEAPPGLRLRVGRKTPQDPGISASSFCPVCSYFSPSHLLAPHHSLRTLPDFPYGPALAGADRKVRGDGGEMHLLLPEEPAQLPWAYRLLRIAWSLSTSADRG